MHEEERRVLDAQFKQLLPAPVTIIHEKPVLPCLACGIPEDLAHGVAHDGAVTCVVVSQQRGNVVLGQLDVLCTRQQQLARIHGRHHKMTQLPQVDHGRHGRAVSGGGDDGGGS